MEATSEIPTFKPLYQAEIYREEIDPRLKRIAISEPSPDFLVMIGAYGSEYKPVRGYTDLFDTSGFVEREAIDRWVREKVTELKSEGNVVRAKITLGFNLLGIINEVGDLLAA